MSTRNLVSTLILAAFVSLTITAFASAQPPAGRGKGMPRYDKASEITVVGTVEDVQSHQGRSMAGMGTHLTFKTDSGVLDVHIGPTAWLTDNHVEFAKRDRLEIIGSSVTIDGQKALIAREITKGDRKITLRDANGIPVWSGRGRRTQS